MTNAEKVEHFNNVVIGIDRQPGEIRDDAEFDFLVGSILEELQELRTARDEGDFVGQLDALTDLIFFAYGGFTRMGIPAKTVNGIFDIVADCNLRKKAGSKTREVRHHLDAIKPEGWKGPEEQIMVLLDEDLR